MYHGGQKTILGSPVDSTVDIGPLSVSGGFRRGGT